MDIVKTIGENITALMQPPSAHVTDIEMSFGSMFVFMLKWAFASIPALIVLFMLIAGLSAAFFGTHARI